MGNERGQMLPFLAVSILILLGWTAVQLGLSKVYLERTRLRDAADAAALAAINSAYGESAPTYLGEKWVPPKYDKDGNKIRDGYWKKTMSSYEDRIAMPTSTMKSEAQRYLERNLQANGISHYKILSFSVQVQREPRELQVHVDRPNTEGRVETYMEPFPRWVRARVTAKLEVPVPLGSVANAPLMQVEVRGETQKTLQNVRINKITGEVEEE